MPRNISEIVRSIIRLLELIKCVLAGMWRPNSTHAPVPRCAGYRVPALRQYIQQEMHAQQAHRTGIVIAFFCLVFISVLYMILLITGRYRYHNLLLYQNQCVH
jgi:hypothetical protein